MKIATLVFALFPLMVSAQTNDLPFIVGCVLPDSITIRDDGEGRAVVTYHNSAELCSSSLDMILTSPNGISAQVIVTLGGHENDYRENIQIIPLTDGMMAIPSEGNQYDGETADYVIMGGLS